jgi:hypothetical protein
MNGESGLCSWTWIMLCLSATATVEWRLWNELAVATLLLEKACPDQFPNIMSNRRIMPFIRGYRRSWRCTRSGSDSRPRLPGGFWSRLSLPAQLWGLDIRKGPGSTAQTTAQTTAQLTVDASYLVHSKIGHYLRQAEVNIDSRLREAA